MSSPTPCQPSCCATPQTVSVPGAEGVGGINAFTITTAPFTIPTADGTTQVTAQVVNSTWMVTGQFLFIPGLVAGQIGVFQVVSKPNSTSVILVYPTYSTNTHAGDVMPSWSSVAPGGSGVAITFPLPIAQGGTAAITKAAAQIALGLGRDQTVQNGSGLAFTIPTTVGTITSMTVTAPATGLYLVLARVTVDYRGVTFGSSQTLTLQVQNTTAGSTVISSTRTTGTPTTQQFVSQDYVLPFITSTLTASQILALQIGISVAASAGTSVVSSASLAIIPLNLS